MVTIPRQESLVGGRRQAATADHSFCPLSSLPRLPPGKTPENSAELLLLSCALTLLEQRLLTLRDGELRGFMLEDVDERRYKSRDIHGRKQRVSIETGGREIDS